MKAFLVLGLALCLSQSAACGLGDEDPFEHALEVTSVCAGFGHACALLPDGRVACWGGNWDSQLGVEGLPEDMSFRPMIVQDLFDVDRLFCMALHTCVLKDGTLGCWGGPYGPSPVEAGAPSDTVWVGGGSDGECALTEEGKVFCWGNLASATEDDVPEEPWEETVDMGISGTVSLDASGSVACALRHGGEIRCWGLRLDVDMEDERRTEWAEYVLGAIDDPAGLALALAPWDGGCAWSTGGRAWCFGDNALGQVGDGTLEYRPEPVPIEALSGVKQIAAGTRHRCAVGHGGQVLCWGSTASGALGDGSGGIRAAPTPWPVKDLPPAGHAALAHRSSFAVLENGRLAAWGDNYKGLLGVGEDIPASRVPLPVLSVAE